MATELLVSSCHKNNFSGLSWVAWAGLSGCLDCRGCLGWRGCLGSLDCLEPGWERPGASWECMTRECHRPGAAGSKPGMSQEWAGSGGERGGNGRGGAGAIWGGWGVVAPPPSHRPIQVRADWGGEDPLRKLRVWGGFATQPHWIFLASDRQNC